MDMYFVSRDYGDNTYGITDTSDNIEERYSLEDIISVMTKGIKIYGVSFKQKKVLSIFRNLEDLYKSCMVKLRLMGYDRDVIGLNDGVIELVKIGDKNTIRYKVPNCIMSLGDGCFQRCGSLQDVVLPDSIISLGAECFSGCKSLRGIELPDSLTSLSMGCFYSCTSLQSIELPNSISYLGGSCFNNCNQLQSMELPDSITSLGVMCFGFCSSLQYIKLSDSVTSLGNECFYGCTSLKNIELPDSIKSLGYYCFDNCNSLENIIVSKAVYDNCKYSLQMYQDKLSFRV